MRIVNAINNNVSHYLIHSNQINDLNILRSNLTALLAKSTTSKSCSEIIYHLSNVMILTLEKLNNGENSPQFKKLQQKIGFTKKKLHEILSLLKEKHFIDYTSEKNQILPTKITFNKSQIENFIYLNS